MPLGQAKAANKIVNDNGRNHAKETLLPLIPDETVDELNSENSVQFSLRSNPGDANCWATTL